MLTSLSINWHSTLFAELKEFDDFYFYAISRNGQLLYIGESTDNHVRLRISEHIREKFKNDTKDLVVWFGIIRLNSHQKLSKQMVLEAESLLIFLNQPLLNVIHKKSYSGRDRLRVRSHGCPLLLPKVEKSKGRLQPLSRLPTDLRQENIRH
jgi:hypothetical protein